MQNELTEREKLVLIALMDYIIKRQYTPTTTDMSRVLDLDSKSIILIYDQLEAKGYITRKRKTPRSQYLTALKVLRSPDNVPIRLAFVPLEANR